MTYRWPIWLIYFRGEWLHLCSTQLSLVSWVWVPQSPTACYSILMDVDGQRAVSFSCRAARRFCCRIWTCRWEPPGRLSFPIGLVCQVCNLCIWTFNCTVTSQIFAANDLNLNCFKFALWRRSNRQDLQVQMDTRDTILMGWSKVSDLKSMGAFSDWTFTQELLP